MSRTTREAKLLTVLFLLGFGVIVVRNAWLSDDAYITFRTVDNFINGYGLTWNPGERVQAYTHPLWMFLVSAVYFFSREIYFTSLFLSIVVSLLTVSILAWRGARSTFSVSLGIAVLTLSKAFVDYSTSGLENPLTHLILVLFLLIYIQSEPDLRRLFYLALLTALGTLNRVDTVLLFLPVLGYALLTLRAPLKNRLAVVAIGLAPFVLWELFSFFYYGFPFPNTAYAKLNVGLVSRSQLLEQGIDYCLNSIHLDPVTPLVISLGIIAPLVLKAFRLLPAVAGILLYLPYVLWIGGDFMSGRFFAAPLLVAVTVLMNTDLQRLKAGRFALFALILGVGLSSSYSPVLPGFNRNAGTDSNRVTDEKGNYWPNTALLRARRQAQWPDHDWAQEGRAARIQSPGVVEKGSVGFYGYFAGPEIHVVDLLGLADPLLARLPPVDPHWSIGHFGRRAPEGYIETLATGENHIRDPNLAVYYDKLSLVTRGNLFNLRRLGEIWKLNTGAYDRYLDAYATFEGEKFVQRLTFTNPTDAPYAYAFVWNNGTAEAFLLDDASRRGSVYSVTWTITTDRVSFDGDHKEKIASIGPLDGETTLNVGVFFSKNPDLTSNNIFEHRYWFRIVGDRLVILLQGIGWHNEAAPGGTWAEADVSHVIRRSWPLVEDVSD
jgi:arabinofuranosyltransferase